MRMMSGGAAAGLPQRASSSTGCIHGKARPRVFAEIRSSREYPEEKNNRGSVSNKVESKDWHPKLSPDLYMQAMACVCIHKCHLHTRILTHAQHTHTHSYTPRLRKKKKKDHRDFSVQSDQRNLKHRKRFYLWNQTKIVELLLPGENTTISVSWPGLT